MSFKWLVSSTAERNGALDKERCISLPPVPAGQRLEPGPGREDTAPMDHGSGPHGLIAPATDLPWPPGRSVHSSHHELLKLKI